MPRIKILPHVEICPNGIEIDAPAGISLCDALLGHDIDIEHACEKVCACTTCHVLVRVGYDSIGDPTDDEDDLLDRAWGLEQESRLSCQVMLSDTDLTIEIPRYSINHAKEDH